MELVKKSVRLSCMEHKMAKEKTYDEDMNVPDSKGDINKIICSTYDAVTENARMADGKGIVKGVVNFDILYLNGDNGGLEHLEGSFPFEENMDLGGVSPDYIKCEAVIEDFTVKVINSRKVNIKSLMKICCVGDVIDEAAVLTDVSDEQMLLRSENINFAQIKADCEDNYRVKEEFSLPKNKPNVRNIIWKDMRLKSREVRLLDDCVFLKGEVGIFVVYVPDDDSVLQWYETSIPFEGRVDVSSVSQEMLGFVTLDLCEATLTVKPDYDGEERVMLLEGIVKLGIKAYSEEELSVVCDMYSTTNNVDIECVEKNYQQAVVKNSLKGRGYNKYKISDMEDKPLQICYAYGTPHLESTRMKDGELVIEGYADVCVIYVCADDSVPMSAFKCQVPFTQTVSVDSNVDAPEFMVNVCVDQINASMIGGDEIEVRVFVGIEVLVMNVINEKFIENAAKTPMTTKELAEFPGIVGYIATKNESLWDVAKRYKTTEEKLRNVNKLSDDNVKKGSKIIVTR